MKEYLEKGYVINLLEHNDKVYHYADRDKENIVNDTVQTLCRVMMEAEAADVQPVKRGKWEEIEDYDGDSHYGCTACGAEFYLEAGTPSDNEYCYCPHCGADMRGEGNG